MAEFPTTGKAPLWGPMLKAYIDSGDVLPERLSKDSLDTDYAPLSSRTKPVQFGKLTLGDTSVSGRTPLKSSQGINSGQTGPGNHVAHLFQTIVTGGGWDTDPPPDPGFVWGTNFYTTTGTNPGDADGVETLYGGLVEAAISAPAGSAINSVIGMQAEASFAGATSGATVNKMISLNVENPRRKDGAAAGTAMTAIGLRVKAVTAADTGAGAAYSMQVEGGVSLFNSTVTVLTPATGSGSTADSLTLQSSASQVGALLRFRDSGGSNIGRVTAGGITSMYGRAVFCESRTQQVSLGDIHPGDANAAAITLGSANDTTIFRAAAGVLAMRDQQVTRTGRGTTAQRPNATTVGTGAHYFDTTIGKPVWADGTTGQWKDATGAVV